MQNTTNNNSAPAIANAAQNAEWGNPAMPAGTVAVQQAASRSALGKAIAPRLAGGIAYAQVSAAVQALESGKEVPENAMQALDAFCGQVKALLGKLVQNHTVCTIYNYLQDRTGGVYSRAQVREALPDYAPVFGLKDSKDLRAILGSIPVAERVGMQLVVTHYNAGGRARTVFTPYSAPVQDIIPDTATTSALEQAKASTKVRKSGK